MELRFLKELMLIRQENQKGAMFVTIDIFQIKAAMSEMDAMIY